MPCEKENLTLLLFPPENGKNPITILEVGPASGVCPQNLCKKCLKYLNQMLYF